MEISNKLLFGSIVLLVFLIIPLIVMVALLMSDDHHHNKMKRFFNSHHAHQTLSRLQRTTGKAHVSYEWKHPGDQDLTDMLGGSPNIWSVVSSDSSLVDTSNYFIGSGTFEILIRIFDTDISSYNLNLDLYEKESGNVILNITKQVRLDGQFGDYYAFVTSTPVQLNGTQVTFRLNTVARIDFSSFDFHEI